MRLLRTLYVLGAVIFLSTVVSFAEEETLMMRFPDIYKEKVVFTYAGDLWLADVNGGVARQLTSSEGLELFAKFSPDGEWIAYTGQYNGYYQVYVIPVKGGEPKQLTFYPSAGFADHQVLDWTPDGKYILFRSTHSHIRGSYSRLFKISKDGGWPEPLPFTEGGSASFSPDGKKIALNRMQRDFATWKRYKGGQHQNIWIYDFSTDKIEQATNWEGTDRHPMWHKNEIYYISDTSGKLNIHKLDLAQHKTSQVTDFKDWDINWPGYDSNSMIFEKGGHLYRMTFNDEKVSEVKIKIGYDRLYLKPTYINAVRSTEGASLAAGAKRFAVVARGELFTIPADKGDVRNLSNSPGIREKSAAWSPDGKWIAYLADDTGTEEIYLIDQQGKDKVQLTKDSKSILYNPVWSKDSRKIAFSDAGQKLYYAEVDTKKVTLVDTAKKAIPFDYNWSPDGSWIAYTKVEENNFPAIYLYNVDKKTVHRVTSDSSSNYSPVFDPSGKYLYFISQRDFAPTLSSFDSSFIYVNTDRVYAASLKKDIPSPFEPQSDEVEVKAAPPADKGQPDKGKEQPGGKKPGAPEAAKPVKVEIDLEGLENRVEALPVAPSNIFGLTASDGAVFYLKRPESFDFDLFGEGGFQRTLFAFDFKTRKEVMLLGGVRFYDLSPDGKNILWATMTHYGIAPAAAQPINKDAGKPIESLKLEATKVPAEEWKQMLKEAWRLEKNFFYVENMHGVDWAAMLDKYMALAQHLSGRFDLTYLMGEMIAELCTSHTYVAGGDMPQVQNMSIGLLGCEFEPDKDGYFRIKKVYKGENWERNGRSPLTEPGVKASEGDYILEINGKKLRLPDNPYKLLEMTNGKIVTLKLNKKPEEKGSWTTDVKSVASEMRLRYLDWVESNRLKVEKATGGKVGYVHIPDMMFDGLNRFTKMWFSQLNKQGIIVDERFNGGGFVSQAILERLRRIAVGMFGGRIGGYDAYPDAAFRGHLVMLENAYAGSDGDLFPFYFQKYKLGPVIGTRTWGGVVGISGFTQLMDGGMVTVPTATDYDLEGKWVIENHGVDPDIVVDNLPPDEFKGKDAQLDKAIDVIMNMIKEKPVREAVLPKDPVKLK